MKRLREKLTALLCVLALFLLLLPSAAGVQTMYLMAANDNVLDYQSETMPFVSGGTVYVPYTMFISEYNGGVELGVFYGISEAYNTLSLYTRTDPILTFGLDGSSAYDATGTTYSFRAIVRDGVIFVPAWAVCSYFGLQYSYLPIDQGVLVRVKKDGGYWLSDRFLISSAGDVFQAQKKRFDQDQAASAPVSPSPSAPAVSDAPDKSRVRVCFAFRCDGEAGADPLLDVLEGTDIKGLFFFPADELARRDDQIRRLLAQGHRVGFLVDGSDAEACLTQAEEGNRLLAHIARARTDFLLVDGSDSLRDTLLEQGWACWKGNINAIPEAGVRPASLAANILLNLDAKRSYGRILMDDSEVSAAALQTLIYQIDQAGYRFHAITEVDLT